MSPGQFRQLTPPHDGDTVTLACTDCFDPWADDNEHALIHITDKHPRLDAINQAAENHDHRREADL